MKKILVAEDERDIRELITFTLKYSGFEVVTADNGEEALALIRQVHPDLVLLDVRMPRMTGFEVCQQLKQHDETRDLPVVFLSAKGQKAEIEQGRALGAADYVLKPFSPQELVERVNAILGA